MSNCDCGILPYKIETSNLAMFQKLPDDHVLRTLMKEHFRILGFVRELEHWIQASRENPEKAESSEAKTAIRNITAHFLEGERHHIREDNVIMQRLDNLGVPYDRFTIRKDHDELRVYKRRLAYISENLLFYPVADFLPEIEQIAEILCSRLRTHIKTEDTEVYPLALELIPEKEWVRMKHECDALGYCCFTP